MEWTRRGCRAPAHPPLGIADRHFWRLSALPYDEISLASLHDGQTRFPGKQTMYRYHVEDPVLFSKSIEVTIARGHGTVERARRSWKTH